MIQNGDSFGLRLVVRVYAVCELCGSAVRNLGLHVVQGWNVDDTGYGFECNGFVTRNVIFWFYGFGTRSIMEKGTIRYGTLHRLRHIIGFFFPKVHYFVTIPSH